MESGFRPWAVDQVVRRSGPFTRGRSYFSPQGLPPHHCRHIIIHQHWHTWTLNTAGWMRIACITGVHVHGPCHICSLRVGTAVASLGGASVRGSTRMRKPSGLPEKQPESNQLGKPGHLGPSWAMLFDLQLEFH